MFLTKNMAQTYKPDRQLEPVYISPQFPVITSKAKHAPIHNLKYMKSGSRNLSDLKSAFTLQLIVVHFN